MDNALFLLEKGELWKVKLTNISELVEVLNETIYEFSNPLNKNIQS